MAIKFKKRLDIEEIRALISVIDITQSCKTTRRTIYNWIDGDTPFPHTTSEYLNIKLVIWKKFFPDLPFREFDTTVDILKFIADLKV